VWHVRHNRALHERVFVARKGLWWASRCLQLDVAMAAPSAA
jgi:hypothetical protein